jgi:hypothetical protein
VTLFHGYYIEMKSYGEKPRPDQKECLEALARLGYRAQAFDLWQDAARSIVEHMRLEKYAVIDPPAWLNLYLRVKDAQKRDRRR